MCCRTLLQTLVTWVGAEKTPDNKLRRMDLSAIKELSRSRKPRGQEDPERGS